MGRTGATPRESVHSLKRKESGVRDEEARVRAKLIIAPSALPTGLRPRRLLLPGAGAESGLCCPHRSEPGERRASLPCDALASFSKTRRDASTFLPPGFSLVNARRSRFRCWGPRPPARPVWPLHFLLLVRASPVGGVLLVFDMLRGVGVPVSLGCTPSKPPPLRPENLMPHAAVCAALGPGWGRAAPAPSPGAPTPRPAPRVWLGLRVAPPLFQLQVPIAPFVSRLGLCHEVRLFFPFFFFYFFFSF